MRCTALTSTSKKFKVILEYLRDNSGADQTDVFNKIVDAGMYVTDKRVSTWMDRLVKDGYCVNINGHYEATRLGTKTLPDPRCQQTALDGTNVCIRHGGQLPNVKRKAASRLERLIDPALDSMERIITTSKHDPSVLSASKDVLDRTVGKTVEKVDITLGYDAARLDMLSADELAFLAVITEKLKGLSKSDSDADSNDSDED